MDILFFAIVAAVIGYKLFSVLGHRDFDPKSKDKPMPTMSSLLDVTPQKEEAKTPTLSMVEEEKALVEFGPSFSRDIEEIKRIDSSFSVKHFLDGAAMAFEMVLKAFAGGDKQTLSSLLSPSIYKGFERVIEERASKGHTQTTTLLARPKMEVKRVRINGAEARITIGFKSEQVNVLKDIGGTVIDGDPMRTEHVYDEWTFMRVLNSRDPNWLLVDTRIEAA